MLRLLRFLRKRCAYRKLTHHMYLNPTQKSWLTDLSSLATHKKKRNKNPTKSDDESEVLASRSSSDTEFALGGNSAL